MANLNYYPQGGLIVYDAMRILDQWDLEAESTVIDEIQNGHCPRFIEESGWKDEILYNVRPRTPYEEAVEDVEKIDKVRIENLKTQERIKKASAVRWPRSVADILKG